MTFGIVGAIGSAVIGAGASIAGASRASSASRHATNAATAANQANIQLAREERSANQALYAGDIARGNRADAFRDAINYGAGRYRSSPSGGAAGVAGEAGGQQVPDYSGFRAQWEPTTVNNRTSPFFYDPRSRSADDQEWSEWYSEFTGNEIPMTTDYGDIYGGDYGDAIEGEYTDVTQADIDALVRNQFVWRQGDEDFAYNEGLTDDAFNYDMGLLRDQRFEGDARAGSRFRDAYGNATDRFGALMGLAGDERFDAYDRINEGLGVRNDITGLRYDLANNNAGARFGDRSALTGASLSGRDRRINDTSDALLAAYGQGRNLIYGGAGNRFNRSLGYLTEDLGERRGYTDTAIGDFERLTDIYAERDQNRITSALGLTGQIGKASDAYADAAYENALRFSTTTRDWRNQDYNPFADGRLNADRYRAEEERNADQWYADGNVRTEDQRGARLLDSFNTATGEMRADLGTLYDQYGLADSDFTAELRNNYDVADAGWGATDANYYNLANPATSDLFDTYGAAYGQLYDGLDANAAGYNAGALTASGQRTGRRFANNDARSGARRGAYDQWMGGINADSDRGVNARSGIAGVQNTFTNRATGANNANAAAHAQNAQNQADISGAAAGQIASTVGDAWASYDRNRRNRRNPTNQPGDPPFPI